MFGKIVEVLKETIVLSNDVKNLTDEVKGLDINVREIDRRVVRMETYVDISKQFS
jgi:hypothetical protein